MSDGVNKDDMPCVLFPDLNPEDWNGVTEIESLCMHCYEQVRTVLSTLLNKVDKFVREM